MKAKELVETLRIPTTIEFRFNNYKYGMCISTDGLAKDLGDYEVEDWFVFSEENSICINLKKGIETNGEEDVIY